MKKIKLAMLIFIIGWHWWFVLRYRALMEKLISQGMAFTSPWLCRLDSWTRYHAHQIVKYSKKYNELAENLLSKHADD